MQILRVGDEGEEIIKAHIEKVAEEMKRLKEAYGPLMESTILTCIPKLQHKGFIYASLMTKIDDRSFVKDVVIT